MCPVGDVDPDHSPEPAVARTYSHRSNARQACLVCTHSSPKPLVERSLDTPSVHDRS
jgi:hypothetical protein